MTHANYDVYETVMRELKNVVICDTDETKEREEDFSFQEATDVDEIPASLLSYFQSSKSRAAVCEKLILEEPEDFFAPHQTEDMTEFPTELDEDMNKLKKRVVCDLETDESSTPTDSSSPRAPQEIEKLLTHNEGEAETDKYEESEKHSAFGVRTLEIPLDEYESLRLSEYEAEREKRRCEKVKEEERRRQVEGDFQKELKKIVEAEKINQRDLEMMWRRAQEELDQELLLQQEVISNKQKRVEEERKRVEEEQRRLRDEEEQRRKKEEEEQRRLRDEEELRRLRDEEEQRKLREEEEQRRKKEEEEQRKLREEEEQRKLRDEEEKRRLRDQEEQRRLRDEEELRKLRDEEEQRRKKEEEEKRRLRDEEEQKRKRDEEEQRRKRDEEEQRRKRDEEEQRRKRDEEEQKRKRDEEEQKRKRDEEEQRKKRDEEEQKRKRDEEEQRGRRVEEDKREREAEREKIEAETGKEEEDRMKEKEETKMKEVKLVKEEEWKKAEEERRRKEREKTREEERVFNLEKEKLRKMMDVKEERNKKEEEEEEKEWKRNEERKKIEEARKVEREKREKEQEKVQEEEERNKKEEENLRLKEERIKTEEYHKDQTKISSSVWISPRPAPSHIKSAVNLISTETTPQHNTTQSSTCETVGCENPAESPSSGSDFVFLPEHTELKRLTWMKECIPWTKLSLQNRRKQRASFSGGRGTRRTSSLPPLCPDLLLRSTSWKSLKEVTTVTLEDLPSCSLSTLSQCTQLQCLTLRRCGLKSLEGIKQLPHLCYIDVQENEISSIDCENMANLRVLNLCHNKLTSIHGLTGAENLDVLELTDNSITRIAGLESMKRLQRLSLDHNQLISTKGLKDVFTLLHLNCSYNHLVKVEGVENSALLNTLDLRANSLTEPPSLNNQVLLRELHLDDNSICSLQSLADCWLPLLQHLSVAQNRITQLPSMSDAVSLANIDLRFNCLSELQSVSESLKKCQFLHELHLTGNPLQQESGWRSSLQKALPGLRAIDDQQTDSFSSPPAVSVQQVSSTSGSFLTFCQAQLQQTQDLEQEHSEELSKASSPLDAAKISCRHFTETLQLAVEQRFAHEYGDTSVGDKHKAAAPTTDQGTLTVDQTKSEEHPQSMKTEITGNVSPVLPNSDNISSRLASQIAEGDSGHKTVDSATCSLRMRQAGSVITSATTDQTSSINPEVTPVSDHQILALQNKAAFVIQQQWWKYKQEVLNMGCPVVREGGDIGGPESRPAFNNRSVVDQERAATVIQAFWRGCALRKRLICALAAVRYFDTGEDDTLEEVDVDGFVFDEAALEEHWTPLCEDPLSRKYTVSQQQQQHTVPPPLAWRSKHAWVDEDQEDSGGQRVSPVSSVRGKHPASTPRPSSLAERPGKILDEWGFTQSRTAEMMLKRAQKMKSKKKQQKKRLDPLSCQSIFGTCSYQIDPVGAQSRRAKHQRNYVKAGGVELGLQVAEKTERAKQERTQQWLHAQAVHSDRDSESLHFLPEISADILNGGRVQLVADPGYTEHQHHASGLWANSSSAARPCKEDSYPRSNSLGHARKEVTSPKQVSSAPSKKERISFRDNPVQMSGGWGGGKKRDRVHK
ncbi:leucine-rich repeat and IQ domain-containing protein 1 [Xyrichtys novacula]|uniref:Leucine-rich repeat and IQ domain-containing protein 1 n=1 Tax=Xyrichtys novacula TaxID=13765 RepID=A0AAV1F521_XYRNO|nr:leucine-rich repeat and IQ domain-containing protein 1 [Xyrichtys novacula]